MNIIFSAFLISRNTKLVFNFIQLCVSCQVYLYAESQPNKKRSELPDIRKGEYEALSEKLRSLDMQPDFGPSDFVPSWGATCVGAREFLIAYNINVLGTKEQAHRIALNIREQGRSEKDVSFQR